MGVPRQGMIVTSAADKEQRHVVAAIIQICLVVVNASSLTSYVGVTQAQNKV